MTQPVLEIHYDVEGEWAALYVDGKLEIVGDSYLAEERAFKLLGVTTLQDDAFLRGQTEREGVAQTLTEVDAFRQARDEKIARAADLRAQANALWEEAAAIDPRTASSRAAPSVERSIR